MTDSRERLERYVQSRPGVHFSGLVDALDQATGQVQYHAARLVRAGRLERETVHGRTHYYPAGYDEREREVLAVLRRETTRNVVRLLLRSGGRRPSDLAGELDLARSTVEYHLDRLAEHEMVEKRRDGDGRVTAHLVRPRETERLFATVEPGDVDRPGDHPERPAGPLLEGTE